MGRAEVRLIRPTLGTRTGAPVAGERRAPAAGSRVFTGMLGGGAPPTLMIVQAIGRWRRRLSCRGASSGESTNSCEWHDRQTVVEGMPAVMYDFRPS